MFSIFKFGGASIKDANAVKNAFRIIQTHKNESGLICVFSAMGKTTNALEKFLNESIELKLASKSALQEIMDFHFGIIENLFDNERQNLIKSKVSDRLNSLSEFIGEHGEEPYDYLYDQIISAGELISTDILQFYAETIGIDTSLIDVRKIIETDNNYREGKINWEQSEKNAQNIFSDYKENSQKDIFITQGFIGRAPDGSTTTLGREGSDYTAGILAYLFHAESVTIWKDVPGVLNADPKLFPDAQMFHHLSYDDTIELAYYGVSVIHPKTIKPLKSKKIKLYVKSFINDTDRGTLIDAETGMIFLPSFIIKQNQLLLSIGPNDFSFLTEENLSEIFGLLARFKVKVSLMQNSASGIKISVDNDSRKTKPLRIELSKMFDIQADEGLQLITVRNYNHAIVEQLLRNKNLLLEQKTDDTIRLVVKPLDN
jgi:aspartate kinase